MLNFRHETNSSYLSIKPRTETAQLSALFILHLVSPDYLLHLQCSSYFISSYSFCPKHSDFRKQFLFRGAHPFQPCVIRATQVFRAEIEPLILNQYLLTYIELQKRHQSDTVKA